MLYCNHPIIAAHNSTNTKKHHHTVIPLTSAENPVDGGGLLVRAHVAGDGHQHEVRELRLQNLNRLQTTCVERDENGWS